MVILSVKKTRTAHLHLHEIVCRMHCTQTKPDSMLLRSWLVKNSLEEENLVNATAAANKNETTKKARRQADMISMPSQDDHE